MAIVTENRDIGSETKDITESATMGVNGIEIETMSARRVGQSAKTADGAQASVPLPLTATKDACDIETETPGPQETGRSTGNTDAAGA